MTNPTDQLSDILRLILAVHFDDPERADEARSIAVSRSWWSNEGQPGYTHQCSSHCWDGQCLEVCHDDDRYRTEDGREVWLCHLHRSPRRQDGIAILGRTEHVRVTWAGERK